MTGSGEATAGYQCPDCGATFDRHVCRGGTQGCCPECGSKVRGRTRDPEQEDIGQFAPDGGRSSRAAEQAEDANVAGVPQPPLESDEEPGWVNDLFGDDDAELPEWAESIFGGGNDA